MERYKKIIVPLSLSNTDTSTIAWASKVSHLARSEEALFIHAVEEQDSDFVIIGRESFRQDMAIRLTRKAPCSVMIIPPDADVSQNKILAPTDFSTYCSNAEQLLQQSKVPSIAAKIKGSGQQLLDALLQN
jgi:hypothetical protein